MPQSLKDKSINCGLKPKLTKNLESAFGFTIYPNKTCVPCKEFKKNEKV